MLTKPYEMALLVSNEVGFCIFATQILGTSAGFGSTNCQYDCAAITPKKILFESDSPDFAWSDDHFLSVSGPLFRLCSHNGRNDNPSE